MVSTDGTATVSGVCARFLERARLAKGLSPHSIRAYAIDLDQFRTFVGGDTGVGDVDRDTLERFLAHLRDERGLLSSSVKRRFAPLKVLFAELERDGMIADSPFRRFEMRLKLPRRLPRNLTRTEIETLAPELDGPAPRRGQMTEPGHAAARGSGDVEERTTDLAILLLLTTGIRVGELAGIRLGDIDLSDRSIRIRGKGNRERRVFLVGAATERRLARYLSTDRARVPDAEAHDRLLVTRSGAPTDPSDLRRLLRTRAEALGLERRITPHMLRHTAATRYLERGVDIRYVQRLLGHASISTTEIYAAASDEGLRRAIGG